MGQKMIDKLIINSPYEEPSEHWHYDAKTRLFDRLPGRRPAGYIVASEKSKSFDDPGVFYEIPLVNRIRPRIKAWREAGYPGATGITHALLHHWYALEERTYRRFFFCQLEAMETLMWLVEAPAADRVGIDVPSDGGEFQRLCSKMATGSGKTVVMAMLIAWQVVNKVTYPQDPRFSKYVFVVAPGLTVRNRLQVLQPDLPGNYYDEFNVLPTGLREKLRQGKVLVRNWHALQWDTEDKLARKRSVDRRGVKSDEAYVRDVLGEMARAENLIVINDEAHHAWNVPAESKVKGVRRDEIETATIWIEGLNRIHRARNIVRCYDFSATPFAPSGKQSSEEALFGWIVSDFGLNDAIESGLVKTPRVVVRDDSVLGADGSSRLYHIYSAPEVRDDINRKAEPYEPLPDLITNAYYLLGKDWMETAKIWRESRQKTPPVMITVANRTETAARISYAFDHNKVLIEELCDSARTLHIDSKVLDKAEAQQDAVGLNGVGEDDDQEDGDTPPKKLTRDQQAEQLRKIVDTVGKPGEPGEQIQNVISVGMLSEGWDAKTVTHIMGLRAFSSQLLCEQVVGRGLRRTSYEVDEVTGLYEPEYVNVFGVPFTFLPHEGGDGPPPRPDRPKTAIEAVPEKRQYEIRWPNIIRVDHIYRPVLSLDMDKVKPLSLDAYDVSTIAEIAPIVEGKPDITQVSQIELEELFQRFRLQKLAFEAARDVYDQMQPTWHGNREYLLAQLVRLAERFLASDKIRITPPLFFQDQIKRRLVITLSMTKVVQHIWEAVRFENAESVAPVFDTDRPIRSTDDMPTWYTSKSCAHALKSHINFCVHDSNWEKSEGWALDENPYVAAWVKNDHLGFEIHYIYKGTVRKYRPDFVIRLTNGVHLVLETKGQNTNQDETKRRFLQEWCAAVNTHGGFGLWAEDISTHPKDVDGIIDRHVSDCPVPGHL